MKHLWLAALLFTLLAPLSGCRHEAPPLDAAAKTALASDKLVIVDVRTPAEFAAGHLEGAIHIEVGTFASSTALPADKATPIVTYCAAGVRAGNAVSEIQALGYTDVVNGGGIVVLGTRLARPVVKDE